MTTRGVGDCCSNEEEDEVGRDLKKKKNKKNARYGWAVGEGEAKSLRWKTNPVRWKTGKKKVFSTRYVRSREWLHPSTNL